MKPLEAACWTNGDAMQTAYLSIKTGSRRKQLACLTPELKNMFTITSKAR